MSNYIHGNDLIVYQSGTAIAAAKSCVISKSMDIIEAANNTDGNARSFVPSMLTWTIRVTGLVTNLENNLQVSSIVQLSVRDRNTQSDRLTGNAFVSSAEVTATWGNLAQMSMTFQGAGPLT